MDWYDKVGQAFNYLRGLSQVDPDCIGLMGFSQGGALAISAVPQLSEVAVLVDYFGPNVDGWFVSSWWGYNAETFSGDLASYPPTIILHGSLDPIVPITASRNFYDELKANDRVVGFHEFKGSMHAFNDPGSGMSKSTEVFDQAHALVLDFLNRHLKNEVN